MNVPVDEAREMMGEIGGRGMGYLFENMEKMDIPSGKYTVICKDGKINMKGLGQVSGDELMVPARSAMIIHQ